MWAGFFFGAGANDARALAPGVYFIREGGGSREQ
jgi:hypothetical protein